MRQIELSRGRVALVDDWHYKRLNKFSWCCHTNGRACRVSYGKMIWMHHNVLNLYPEDMPSEFEVDHRDRDPLNNQEYNLRVVTHAVNMQNSVLCHRAKLRLEREVSELLCLSP